MESDNNGELFSGIKDNSFVWYVEPTKWDDLFIRRYGEKIEYFPGQAEVSERLKHVLNYEGTSDVGKCDNAIVYSDSGSTSSVGIPMS